MQNKEWKGNKHSVFVTLGASNHSSDERQPDDYYATEPLATRLLLAEEKFNKKILEPACGEGHMSKELISAGYEVTSFDKVNRGYGDEEDFFCRDAWDGDIITNPPYKCALDFVQHALEIVPEGSKVAFFLKIQFLEGKVRRKFFNVNPPPEKFLWQVLDYYVLRMGTFKIILRAHFVMLGLFGRKDSKEILLLNG